MKKISKKILVIDDDYSFIRLMQKWLRVANYQVVEAFDGHSGLEKAKGELPDLILLDIIMPDMDGKNVARRLHADPATKNIPIIFTTVCIDLKLDKGDQTIEVDGRAYQGFAKPLHNARLLSAIRKTLNRKNYSPH